MSIYNQPNYLNMAFKQTLSFILLILFIISCNSEKKYYNDFYEQLGGNYEIEELNYISSQGADSTIFNAGTFYFEPCEYSKYSSESRCDGEIWIEQLDGSGTFQYEIFNERTMSIVIRWEGYPNNEIDFLGLTAHNCEVFFDGDKTILEFLEKETAQKNKFNRYPHSIVLSKY